VVESERGDGDVATDVATEVVTLGECLVALVAGSPGSLAEAATFERHVAGAEANLAVGLARLGHRVAYIGRVGDDGFGTAILRRLRGEGVRVDCLGVDSVAPTGLLVRERRTLGPTEVLYYRSGSAGSRLEPSDVERAATGGLFADARWLHVTGITPALSASAAAAVDLSIEHARAGGCTISLDINLRRKLWAVEDARPVLRALAEGADILFGSTDELAVLTERDPAPDPAELAASAMSLGPSLVVVKLGAQGALALERGLFPIWMPSIAAAVVDAVGAGDAFAAGFIAARLEGAPMQRALAVGNACGASAVAVVGDMAGLPDRRELDRLLDGPTTGPGDSVR
jgi:2-dehydro-3-deoxygluconokinase